MVIIILREEGVGHSPFIKKLNNSHVPIGHVLTMAPRVAYICLGCLHANYTRAKGRDFFVSKW